jgi:ligand-binding sensor domain-containing protein
MVFNARKNLFVLLVILESLPLFSQSVIPFEKIFTTKDGLSHNDIRCIAQDHYGFLWIGTWDGLSRFDGFEFKCFYSDPNDSSSLPYSHINDIAVDKNNNIWVVGKTLSRYDRSSDSFIRMNKKKYDTLFAEDVSRVELDTTGNLFVTGWYGLYFYENSSDSMIGIPLLDENGKKMSISIY